MYHHQNNGGGGDIFSHRGAFLQERHLFGINNSNNNNNNNLHGDSGLVLSTDAKPRLKWTPELHQRFIEAVNQLGGAEKATPKTVMRLMGIPGLTLYHLKSHLQKYRLSKNMQAQANLGPPKNGIICVGTPDKSPSMISSPSMSNNNNNTNIGPQTERTIHISEALQLQIEVQRQLNEQLEVQRHLQLRIEAQGKYLQAVLEKAQETLGKNNNSELDTKNKANLVPELSQVETECYINKLSPNNLDCSIESSLTEELGKVYNPNLNLNSKFDCKLDLNLREESENLDLSSRRFDLNGFSWN